MSTAANPMIPPTATMSTDQTFITRSGRKKNSAANSAKKPITLLIAMLMSLLKTNIAMSTSTTRTASTASSTVTISLFTAVLLLSVVVIR